MASRSKGSAPSAPPLREASDSRRAPAHDSALLSNGERIELERSSMSCGLARAAPPREEDLPEPR
jgi:hypothetical protein